MQKTIEIANAIADKIEELGHFQGKFDESKPHACCIVLNPSFKGTRAEQHSFAFSLCERIGETVSKPYNAFDVIYSWNDRTPTAEVLSVLRSIDLD